MFDHLLRRFSRVAGIDPASHLLPGLFGLLAREAQGGGRVGAEAKRLAASFDRVVESPAVRTTLDEQQQIETFAVGESCAAYRLWS